VAKEGKSPC